MTIFRRILLLLACAQLLNFSASAEPATERVDGFLPKAGITEAAYVQIERDPAVDDYVRRMREAREKNPAWFLEYLKKHQTSDTAPLPYHENFGVTRKSTSDSASRLTTIAKCSGSRLRSSRAITIGRCSLIKGDRSALTEVTLNLADGTAATPRDPLPRKEFVVSLSLPFPPGRHRGVAYGAANARIIATRTHESLSSSAN